ncbi:MAG: radical SAM protein [Dehalococcoidia bacterium]|nr:radical SAM protein [Dehalococcoidia bacterium]
MKVTLIFPGITGIGFGSAAKGTEGGWIAHGLALLGACTREAGFEADLIDLRALSGWDHLAEEIRRRHPAVCGIGLKSVDFNPAMKAVEVIKQTDPTIITVAGGVHVTLATDEVAANPQIDYIVTREGEIAFVDLLRDLDSGQRALPRIIKGERPDLETLPFADRDLFINEWTRFGYYQGSPEAPIADLPAPFVTVIAGRGCIYNCNFCQPAERTLFGGKVRRRSVANVIAELEQLRQKYAFRSLLIHDDCLTEDRQWVVDFCRSYKERGFQQPFFCQSRADLVVRHQEMIRMMARVGLTGLLIGFESGSQRMLNFLRKGTTVEQNLQAARICKKLGVRIWANYMLGLPTETEEEVWATVRMMKAIDPDYYSPAFYTPLPGSDLYSYVQEKGLSLISDHDSYRRNPTEAKIKGLDYRFLTQALEESQRRSPLNAFKRATAQKVRRYASPRKVARKLRSLVGTAQPAT